MFVGRKLRAVGLAGDVEACDRRLLYAIPKAAEDDGALRIGVQETDQHLVADLRHDREAEAGAAVEAGHGRQ